MITMSEKKRKHHNPGILDWFVDFCINPLKEVTEKAVSKLINTIMAQSPEDMGSSTAAITGDYDEYYSRMLLPSRPLTPVESYELTALWKSDQRDKWYKMYIMALGIESASLGQVDGPVNMLPREPQIAASLELATGWFAAPYKYGVEPYLRRFFLKTYLPGLPPTPDLIQMVVREAFVEEMVVEAPDIFTQNMAEAGYSKEWCDRYWTAHFVPIDLRQAYENLWRGHWDKEQFMRALYIADIHPMWREDIYNVAFRPPSVREMGYGFDTGEYTVEDIVKYRRWSGLSPEDAERAGRSMVAYRTEAERERLRRLAERRYKEGLDTLETYLMRLGQVGTREEVANLWVALGDLELTTDLTLDLIGVAVTDFIKGRSSENELLQDLIVLNVVPVRREAIVKAAKARKAGYVREEVAEQKKMIPVARVRKARDLGLIGDAEYIRRLLDHDYTEEDARLDLAIELTPRPITPEEVERRRTTISSRSARAQRRWETRLARIQGQIELTALQLEDTTIMKDEALDIIDAQIKVYDELIEAATEEQVPVLEERRTVLEQRRELTEARWSARIRRLTEQQTSLLEEKALMERHRDEELGEYEEELKLIGGVAG